MPSSSIPPSPYHTPTPHLIPRQWWRKNIFVVLVGVLVLIVLIVGGIFGSTRLLFLLPKSPTPTPTPVVTVPDPQPSKKVIGDVMVPSNVGEDNFGFNPADFGSMGMGTTPDIVISSKVDMDTEVVLFHLSLNPVFPYDVVSESPREIHITPQVPLQQGETYRFSLDTYYMKGDIRMKREYQWAYEVRQPLSLLESIPVDNLTNVSTRSPLLLTMNSDDIDPATMMKSLSFQPAIKGRIIHRWNHYLFVPDNQWKPLTWYKVTIQKGLGLKKSSAVLDQDVLIHFQTNEGDSESIKTVPEMFLPDTLRVTPEVEEQRARDLFGLYKQKSTSATTMDDLSPLDLDQYHGVLSLPFEEAIPFEKLPRVLSMDVFVVPQSIAVLWQRALLQFQDRVDVHGVVSRHIMSSFFSRVGIGTPQFAPSASAVPNQGVPYEADDLSITELLALIAYTDESWFPATQLKTYFQSVYSSYDATASARAQAAFGLASLGEPYVQEQVNLLNDAALTPIDRLYLGLGLDRLGASEYTALVYRDTITDYKTTTGMIDVSDFPQRNKYATLLTALAGFTVDREDSDVRRYLDAEGMDGGTLLDTMYLTTLVERQPLTPSPFQRVLSDANTTIKIDETYRMWGTQMNLNGLKTLKLQGDRTGLRLLIAY